MRQSFTLLATLACATASVAVHAQDMPATPGGKEALEILTRAIEIPTVAGRGRVPELAASLETRYREAGFPAEDVSFTPVGETGYFTARYRGRDSSRKPIVIIAHMDVVEAKPEDWERDPFTAIIEDGYVFGRGASDNKSGIATVTAAMLALKREGFVPDRDIIVGFTGDEETGMKSTAAMAEALRIAEFVLNADGIPGQQDSEFNPIVYALQAGEKTYADYQLTITDPGGHSSRPGATNALVSMSEALARIGKHRFDPQLSPLTRAYWQAAAERAPAEVAEAMRAFAADPADEGAAETLSAKPAYVGIVRTTCVPTMIEGGHAPNALPQSVTANVNCRIFPGTSVEEIRRQLESIAAEPSLKVTALDTGTVATDESPLRDDVLAAVRIAVDEQAPGLTIVPYMSAGGTDSMHFRALGVPSYGTGGIFMRSEDSYAHGLNERLPLASLDPGVRHWVTLVKALTE